MHMAAMSMLTAVAANTHDNGQNQCNTQNWKHIAPTPGQSKCKVANGTTLKWCGKCKHWMTSHNTDLHGKQNEANMCLVPDPSIWSFGIDSALSLHDLWTLLGPMIMSFICGFMASGILAYAAKIASLLHAGMAVDHGTNHVAGHVVHHHLPLPL